MTLYRRRPSTVEAFQWQPDVVTMDNKRPLPDWLLGRCVVVADQLTVFTPNGHVKLKSGDWVVHEKNESCWVYSGAIFSQLYELVVG